MAARLTADGVPYGWNAGLPVMIKEHLPLLSHAALRVYVSLTIDMDHYQTRIARTTDTLLARAAGIPVAAVEAAVTELAARSLLDILHHKPQGMGVYHVNEADRTGRWIHHPSYFWAPKPAAVPRAIQPAVVTVSPPAEPEGELLTIEAAGRLLGLCRTVAYRLVATGQLPVVRRADGLPIAGMPSRTRAGVTRAAIDAYRQEHTVPETEAPLLTTAQVAAQLHLSKTHICRLARRGLLPAAVRGRAGAGAHGNRFTVDAVDRFQRDRQPGRALPTTTPLIADDAITIKSAVAATGLSQQALRRAIAAGRLPEPIKEPGKPILVDSDAVIRYGEERADRIAANTKRASLHSGVRRALADNRLTITPLHQPAAAASLATALDPVARAVVITGNDPRLIDRAMVALGDGYQVHRDRQGLIVAFRHDPLPDRAALAMLTTPPRADAIPITALVPTVAPMPVEILSEEPTPLPRWRQPFAQIARWLSV